MVYPRYTIGSWERGETFPTMKQVKEIEKIYHIPYDQIIFALNYTLRVIFAEGGKSYGRKKNCPAQRDRQREG